MKIAFHSHVFGRGLRLALCLGITPLLSYSQTPTPNPPGQISYQGFLTDVTGVPLATTAPKNYDVIFRIYSAPTGGATLWGEIQTVTVNRGYFSVLLGQGAYDNSDVWTNNLVGIFTGNSASDRYVGITVKGITNPDTEISPRLRLLASPYAFLAANANALVSGAGQELITTSGGNVGINNPSPAAALDVGGTVNATSFSGGGANLSSLNANNITAGTLSDQRLSANVPLLNGNPVFGGSPVFKQGFAVGNGSKISGDMAFPGNLQFNGTPSFNNGLQLSGGSITLAGRPIYLRNDANDGLIYGNNFDANVNGPVLFGYGGGSLGTTSGGNQQVLSWYSSGQVGIGTTEPARTLDVYGDIRTTTDLFVNGFIYSKFGNSSAGYVGIVDIAGYAIWTSDQRLKQDITPIPNAIKTVEQLRGVSFHWNEDGKKYLTRDTEKRWRSASGKKEDDRKLWVAKRSEQLEQLSRPQLGFIAQEVEQVFPDWVTTDANGYKQINMQKLDAVLVNAIKEQQDEIDAQKQELTALKSSRDALEQRLEALEKALNRPAAASATGR